MAHAKCPEYGNRVVLSERGVTQFPAYKDCEATIVGTSLDHRCWRVKWDHLMAEQTLHKSYLIITGTQP